MVKFIEKCLIFDIVLYYSIISLYLVKKKKLPLKHRKCLLKMLNYFRINPKKILNYMRLFLKNVEHNMYNIL